MTRSCLASSGSRLPWVRKRCQATRASGSPATHAAKELTTTALWCAMTRPCVSPAPIPSSGTTGRPAATRRQTREASNRDASAREDRAPHPSLHIYNCKAGGDLVRRNLTAEESTTDAQFGRPRGGCLWTGKQAQHRLGHRAEAA